MKYCNYSKLHMKRRKCLGPAVYCYVFNGTKMKRIIYVGEAKNLDKRLNDHLRDFRNGKHTIFDVRDGNSEVDIYTLMTLTPKNYHSHELIEKVWVPSGQAKKHHLSANKKFDSEYLIKYLDKICIYYKEFDKESLKDAESSLQKALIVRCGITYYNSHQRHTWLGKIEKPQIDADFQELGEVCRISGSELTKPISGDTT